MTEIEQRIAIAEACGWRLVDDKTTGRPPCILDSDYARTGNVPIPDYSHDLNAIHQAENVLRDRCKYYPDYVDELLKLCTNAYPHLPGEKPKPNWSATIGASAAQRSEAFLRTLGLWKE